MSRVIEDGVYVLLAPGFEEDDVSTVTRSLRRLGMSVAVVGLTAGPMRGAYGLSLVSDRSLGEVEMGHPQAVVLPGGVEASRRLSADPRVHVLLRRAVDLGGYVVALGSAYTVLRSAGVLHPAAPDPGIGSAMKPGLKPDHALRDGIQFQAPGRVIVERRVIIGRNTGSAQEAARMLATLLGESK